MTHKKENTPERPGLTTALLLAALLFTATQCGGTKGFSLARGKERDFSSCMELSRKNKHEEAVQCLEAYRSRHMGSERAADADLAIAETYFAQKDYIVAAEAYSLFAETYPGHPKIPYALGRAGISYYKQAPKSVDRDQTALESALSTLTDVVNYYPGSDSAQEARQYYELVRYKIARKNYNVGRFYFKQGEYLAAIPRFQAVITEYPRLGLDADSFYYLIKALRRTEQTDLANRYFELYKKHNPEDLKAIRKMADLF